MNLWILFLLLLAQDSSFAIPLEYDVRDQFAAEVLARTGHPEDLQVFFTDLIPFHGLGEGFIDGVQDVLSHLIDIFGLIILVDNFGLAKSHAVIIALIVVHELIHIFNVEEGRDAASVEHARLERSEELVTVLALIVFDIKVPARNSLD